MPQDYIYYDEENKLNCKFSSVYNVRQMRYCPEDAEYAVSKEFFTKTKLVLDFTTGK